MVSRFVIRIGVLLVTAFVVAIAAVAEERKDFAVRFSQEPFDDVFFDLESAVIERGLVIDYTGYTNAMLARTADVVTDDDVGSPYINAKFLQFCSAQLTHEAVRANPYNLATCPYHVFAFETKDKPGRVVVGYRKPELGITGPTRFVMEKVDRLLLEIVEAATVPRK